MMATFSFLECIANYCLLLFVAIGLSILPSASSQWCNTNPFEPIIEITSSPPSNKLPVGAAIILTCTAWQTYELAMKMPKTRPRRIEWFDPQGKRAVSCEAEWPAAPRMECKWLVYLLTEEKFGVYTCKASNSYQYCSNKRFQIYPQVNEIPAYMMIYPGIKITAAIGSKVSFTCIDTGNPKPTITWKKKNASNSIHLVVETDDKNPLSNLKLIITRVASKDYGKYVCVVNNSAGVETSKVAELHEVQVKKPMAPTYPGNEVQVKKPMAPTYPGNEVQVKKPMALTYPGNEAPSLSRMSQNGVYKIIALTVPSITVAMLISAYCWHCRRRCLYSKTNNDDPEPSVTCNRSLQEVNQEEHTNDITSSEGHASSIAPCESEKVKFAGHSSEKEQLSDTLHVDLPPKKPPQAGPLPPTPEAQNTSSTVFWNSEQNVTPLSSIQSGCQNHDFESSENRMESGCEIADRRESSHRPPPTCRPLKPRKEIKENTEKGQTPVLEISEANMLHRQNGDFDGQDKRDSVQHSQAPLSPPEPTKGVKVNTEHNEMCCIKSPEIDEGGEIHLERLEIHDKVLGEGEFGIVYQGSYRCNNEKSIDVAVKQLKDNTSATDKVALLTEIRMLKQAGRHPYIVNLVGAYTQGENLLLVTELVPGSNLEKMLKSKRASIEDGKYKNINCGLNDRELINIALQVATGMQHLERKRCIHGDLAARNILIDHNKVARVGDFGLARDISDRGIYAKTSNGKVPWRWLSLESLRFQVYTTQSDVWSFGILLWEIFTFGESQNI